MVRVCLLSTLVASVALAGKPSFSDVVKKFKPATLPLSTKDVPVPKTGLLPEEVAMLGFTRSPSKALATLRQWKAQPDEGETHTLWPVATFTQGEVTALLVRFDQSFPMGSASSSFVLTYSGKGELIDGCLVASSAGTEAGGGEEQATIAADGSITRTSRQEIPMHEEGLPEALITTAETKAKLLPGGKCEVQPATFTTKDGAFIDRTSKEELRVFGERVFYRGNETKPFQPLLREGDAVRFKKGGKPYALAWDERRAVLSCKNPDGTTQRFTASGEEVTFLSPRGRASRVEARPCPVSSSRPCCWPASLRSPASAPASESSSSSISSAPRPSTRGCRR